MSENKANEHGVVIQNKGVLNSEVVSQVKNVARKFVDKEYPNIRDIRLPDETDDLDNKLIEKQVPIENISPELREFTDKCSDYFNEVAKNEGYIDDGETIEWKYVAIKKSDWLTIPGVDTLYPVGADRIGGVFRQKTNIIYLICPDNEPTDEELYQLEVTAFHETRHRICGQDNWFKVELVPLNEEEDEVKVNSYGSENKMGNFTANILEHNPKLSLLEEIFTVGYVYEHIHDMEDERFSRVEGLVINELKNMGGDPEYAQVGFKGSSGFMTEGYGQVLEIYKSLSSQIPDYLEICSRVRAGETGARNELAKNVLEKFNKETLLGLFYTDFDNMVWLSRLVNHTIRDKAGETISKHSTNEQLINSNLVNILDGAKSRGILSTTNQKLLESLKEKDQ